MAWSCMCVAHLPWAMPIPGLLWSSPSKQPARIGRSPSPRVQAVRLACVARISSPFSSSFPLRSLFFPFPPPPPVNPPLTTLPFPPKKAPPHLSSPCSLIRALMSMPLAGLSTLMVRK